jgi:mono/diheme cytochrome c family protein
MKLWTFKHGMILSMCLLALSGCHWDMWDQDKYEPLEGGDFFGEGETSSRTLVAGVVPYNAPRLDDHLYAGRDENGDLVTELPAEVPLTKANLERGRERYEIFCSPCHGADGQATGMIVKRGFPAPPSYLDQRLLEAPIGYFFDVPTNGFGRMYSYATRISVEDRWRIAAYVKTLQLSQNALPEMLTEEILDTAINHPGYVDPDAGGEDAEENKEH